MYNLTLKDVTFHHPPLLPWSLDSMAKTNACAKQRYPVTSDAEQ